MGGLAPGPHVERLVHHEHAQPVAGLEHRDRQRVVRRPDGVETGGPEQLDPALLRPADRRGSEGPVVVVQARAAEQHRLAVDPQALARVQLDRAYAERGPDLRPRLGSGRRRRHQGTGHGVEMGGVDAPSLRLRQVQPVPDQRGLAGGEGHRSLVALDRLAAGVGDRRGQGGGGGGEGLVGHLGGHLDHGLVRLDVQGGDAHPVGDDVHRVVNVQHDGPVEPATGVPAGVLAGADLDPHFVGVAEAQKGLDVDEEARVAVGPVARELVVDEHHRVPERALELQPYGAVGPVGRRLEGLEVGVRAGRVVGPGPLARYVRRAVGIAEGVVRQGHRGRRGRSALCRGERAEGMSVAPTGVERRGGHGQRNLGRVRRVGGVHFLV